MFASPEGEVVHYVEGGGAARAVGFGLFECEVARGEPVFAGLRRFFGDGGAFVLFGRFRASRDAFGLFAGFRAPRLGVVLVDGQRTVVARAFEREQVYQRLFVEAAQPEQDEGVVLELFAEEQQHCDDVLAGRRVVGAGAFEAAQRVFVEEERRAGFLEYLFYLVGHFAREQLRGEGGALAEAEEYQLARVGRHRLEAQAYLVGRFARALHEGGDEAGLYGDADDLSAPRVAFAARYARRVDALFYDGDPAARPPVRAVGVSARGARFYAAARFARFFVAVKFFFAFELRHMLSTASFSSEKSS